MKKLNEVEAWSLTINLLINLNKTKTNLPDAMKNLISNDISLLSHSLLWSTIFPLPGCPITLWLYKLFSQTFPNIKHYLFWSDVQREGERRKLPRN